MSTDLFSVTVGNSALGYEALLGFWDAFIPPLDLRSLNLIFPPLLIPIVLIVAGLEDVGDFPREHLWLDFVRDWFLMEATISLFGVVELFPSPLKIGACS